VETDLAQEFNPGNRSGHPVVTGLNNYTGAQACYSGSCLHRLNPLQLIAPWNVNVGTQTMACADCHGDESTASVVQGPHGSSIKFMLRGANQFWPAQSNGTTLWTLANQAGALGTAAGNGLFCRNCHPDMTTTNKGHTGASEHNSRTCVECHIVIPHGGKLSRLIADGSNGSSGTTMPSRYAWNNDLTYPKVNGFQPSSSYTSYQDKQCGSTISPCSGNHNGYNPTEQW
jgi:hypothetical protein